MEGAEAEVPRKTISNNLHLSMAAGKNHPGTISEVPGLCEKLLYLNLDGGI